jgi:hypothetical protein
MLETHLASGAKLGTQMEFSLGANTPKEKNGSSHSNPLIT